MNRFFAHLAWPFAWTRSGRQRRKENSELVKQQISTMEQRIEELVMGNSYDSMLLGKNKQKNSQWLEVSLVSIMYGE
jgi:hypothetical protein